MTKKKKACPVCPVCGGRVKRVVTFQTIDGLNLTKFKCLVCDHRFADYE